MTRKEYRSKAFGSCNQNCHGIKINSQCNFNSFYEWPKPQDDKMHAAEEARYHQGRGNHTTAVREAD